MNRTMVGKGVLQLRNAYTVTIIDEKNEQEIYVEFSCPGGIDSGDYLKVKYFHIQDMEYC